jgi:HTH-type transcriptional regulator, cell division transcriptional repressor
MLQIHEKIEQARVSAGLTQDEMAEKLNVKRSTYQYWEQKTPSIDKIKAVARALNLSDDYFFGSSDEKKNEGHEDMDSESRRTLERTLENLSEDKIRSTAIIERLVTMLERQFSSQKILTTGEETPETGRSTGLKTGPVDLGLGKTSHRGHKKK